MVRIHVPPVYVVTPILKGKIPNHDQDGVPGDITDS